MVCLRGEGEGVQQVGRVPVRVFVFYPAHSFSSILNLFTEISFFQHYTYKLFYTILPINQSNTLKPFRLYITFLLNAINIFLSREKFYAWSKKVFIT